MHRIAIVVSGLVAAVAAGPIDAAPTYTATPLGVIGRNGSFANGINAAGQVTGSLVLAGFAEHAFLYADGVLHDLGTLGGSFSTGNAINAGGQVVGLATTAANERQAFLYANGVMTDLGGTVSEALGVNVSGQVTGYAASPFNVFTGNAPDHAFLYSNGVMTDLGALGGLYSYGNGINASGQVVGRYGIGMGPGVDRAFLYSNGVMRDLGTLGGVSSAATAINDSGQITGQASIAGSQFQVEHAFLYSGGGMRDLGTLDHGDSIGMAINASGQVAGSFDSFAGYTGIGGASHAFLYSDSTMYDLNSLVVGLAGTLLYVANGINDSGQIVANGCSATFICQAFRLDPSPAPPPAVKVQAIEFYYAPFDHYFITALASEISALDNGMFPGWVRTGEAFNVYSNPSVGSASVCRFFSSSFAPKSSHFYTADAGECSFVKANGGWEFEGVAFATPVPDQQGFCPVSTQPVYRLYNNGQGGAPGHRYTTDLATRAQMIVNGWVPEGYGPFGVSMCAPL